jgi:hypothetical protein
MSKRALLSVVAAALLVACGASSSESDPTAEDELTNGGDARDVEADREPAGRRAELARLLRSESGGTTATDRDGDGIDDITEEDLIRRYRPLYKFSTDDGEDEDRRPADPLEELENAQLKWLSKPGDGVSDPIAGCGRRGDAHLDPPASLYTCERGASLNVSRATSSLCLNLADSRYEGVSFAEAKANATGFSAHVANDTVNGHPAYKVEYWQFFAFNNQDIHILGLGSYGDHEGDWTGVQVWFDRREQRVAQVLYLIHGKSIMFHLPRETTPTCRNCSVSVKGTHFNPNVGNFLDDAARPAYDDNQAELFVDAAGYKHVTVYIERGGHEFWPGAWGHAERKAGPLTFHLNPHNGEGTSYLVPDVKTRPFNLGEVDKPMTDTANLVLSFNGHWGCTNDSSLGDSVRTSPVGPAAHCSWKWPNQGPIAGCEN